MLIINEKGLGSLTGTRHISKLLQKKNKPKTEQKTAESKQENESVFDEDASGGAGSGGQQWPPCRKAGTQAVTLDAQEDVCGSQRVGAEEQKSKTE